jgi:hypothetical protein
MVTFRTIALIAALCTAAIAAKPAKTASLRPAPVFFKSTGEPFELEKPFPGVTAALMLSDQQKMALSEAHQQTVRKPELRNKISALEAKADPTEAEREAVRKEQHAAQVELRKRINAILSAEQKALAEKIQDAAIEAEHEANDFFEAEFDAARDDLGKAGDVRKKARVEAEDLLVQKLEKFLTPAQMQAIQKSAMEQRAAEEVVIKK